MSILWSLVKSCEFVVAMKLRKAPMKEGKYNEILCLLVGRIIGLEDRELSACDSLCSLSRFVLLTSAVLTMVSMLFFIGQRPNLDIPSCCNV